MKDGTFKKILLFFRNGGSVVNTLYFNFKVLDFKTACKLPFAIGSHVQMIGLKNAKIRIKDPSNIKFFSINIGLRKLATISSTKSLWSLLRFEKGAEWTIGNDVALAPGVSICVYRDAHLTIDDDVMVNQRTKLFCKNRINIGAHSRIGWESQIYDTSFHFIYNQNKNQISNILNGIEIGSHCWITNRCTISGNAYLPSFSMLASGSLLNKRFDNVASKGNLFAGSPAILKATGVYRIFNEDYQRELLKYFEAHRAEKFIVPDDDFDIEKYMTTK